MIRSYLVRGKKIEEDVDLERLGSDETTGDTFGWIDLEAPEDEELSRLEKILDVHDLTMKDLVDEGGRPRTEDLPEHLFVAVKALEHDRAAGSVESVNVNALLFEGLLVTCHARPVRAVSVLRERLERRPGRFRDGAPRLLHALLDAVLDRYFDVLEELEETFGDLEPDITGELDPELPVQIFEWRRRLLRLRRRTGPHREALMQLCTTPNELMPEDLRIFYRDLLDKCLRIDDRLNSYRDLLQGAADLYMAGAAQNTNEVMKTLSIVATVVLPLNILTGLYGTNFESIPGAKSEVGFWAFAATLLGLALMTAGYFRWRRWI